MIKVEVWLYQISQPLVFQASNTYQKGFMYCIVDKVNGIVRKFPERHIFRVVEDYGWHGGQAPVENWREQED